ncbi:MAG: DinB family protein [Bacillota bacterium]
MLTFFRYNWQVRDEWFDWCTQISHDELVKQRTGGVRSILGTLFHIIDVEQAWINGLAGKEEYHYDKEEFTTLEDIVTFSQTCRRQILPYIESYHAGKDYKPCFGMFTHGEIMRHVIAHEIHHVGQLSIWSRELNREPITANLIRRGLYNTDKE